MKTIKFVTQALILSTVQKGKAQTEVFGVGTKVVTQKVPESFSSFEKKGIIKVREATESEKKKLREIEFV
jgi:hypothetical protein